MAVVGLDRHLPAEERTRGEAEFAQGQRGQTRRDLFAGRNHDVIFLLVGEPAETIGPRDQLVGDTGHRRDHHRDLIAGIGFALDAARHRFDPVDIGDGRAAEFLHDTRHVLAA